MQLVIKWKIRRTFGICGSPNVAKVLNIPKMKKNLKSSSTKMLVPYRKTFFDPLYLSEKISSSNTFEM